MAELFSSGRVVGAIIVLMLIEYAVLTFFRWRLSFGPSNVGLAANFAAGAALLLSLRAALIGSPWQIVSIWLLLALLAHAADLKIRWAAQCCALQ